MTYADLAVSPRRNAKFLTDAQREVLMPSEAELLAIDHAVNLAKNLGMDLGARYRLQREIAEARFV